MEFDPNCEFHKKKLDIYYKKKKTGKSLHTSEEIKGTIHAFKINGRVILLEPKVEREPSNPGNIICIIIDN
jgi:hypothetical protein